MYNSIIVGFLVKTWNVFVSGYEYSLVKKVADGIKNFIYFLFKGSIVKGIFTEDKGLISKSRLYMIYSWILKKLDIALKKINNYLGNIGANSGVYNGIYKLFRNEIEIINTISVFFLFFGIGIIINNLRIGAFAGKSYIISIILILGSFIATALGENINRILENSYCYNFVKDLFVIDDEGGEQWW